MRTQLLDYHLPPSLIARWPSAQRQDARLMVVDREGVLHRRIRDWPDLVDPGALIIVNDTRVLRARLRGVRRGTRGKVEILLLRRLEPAWGPADPPEQRWTALGRANRPLRSGDVMEAGPLTTEVLRVGPEGVLCVSVSAASGVLAALARYGHVPIPPYLRREDAPCDSERYQTVYASHDGSVAAPTAGLHLTEELLGRLQGRGTELGRLTLHVGLGTFRQVTVDDLDDHPMHAEWFEVDSTLAAAVQAVRARHGPVVAVGTTVVRALESASDPQRPELVVPGPRETRLLIQPGYSFRVVDALLTNFHQPRSTLLALVVAFAGRERTLAAYQEAIEQAYRFLSYGDAMWIPRRLR